MANDVFANGREIACKSGSGKAITAFPDVCFTPPENPATPPGVPVPYPITSMDGDTNDGTRSVKISRKEAMQKNKSTFKKCSGDEAGCAAKKGIMSSVKTGQLYFKAWSMDVKIEGENACRHFDITTSNHACEPANAAIPWPFVDTMTSAQKKACEDDIKKEKEACKDYTPYKKNGKDVCEEAGLSSAFTRGKGATTIRAKSASANPCSAARRCRLVKYSATPDGVNGCCPAQTPDHLVPKSSFYKISCDHGELLDSWPNYSASAAPCMCLEGGSCSGSHGLRSAHHKAFSPVAAGTERAFTDEVEHCAAGAKEVAPQCSQACVEAQLKAGHKGMGDQRSKVKHSPTGKNFIGRTKELMAKIKEMLPKAGITSR